MIDHGLIRAAIRTRLLMLSIVTTGTVDTLSATATGYHRTAGSFLTDGFCRGMEVTPTGFTQTAVGVVSDVTASDLTIAGGRTAQAVGAGRSIACLLPAARIWEGATYKPVVGIPYVREQYLAGGAPAQDTFGGVGGKINAWPMYVLNVYLPTLVGTNPVFVGPTGPTFIEADNAYATAIINLFPPKWSVALANGDALRVPTKLAPFRSQTLPDGPSWAVITVSVPLWVESTNSL